MRRMDAEVGQIEKERLVLVASDEILRLVGQEISEVSALGIFDGRVGDEIEMDSGTFDGLIESSFCRVIFRLEPEMPFAEHCGGVPGGFKPLGVGILASGSFVTLSTGRRGRVCQSKRSTPPTV